MEETTFNGSTGGPGTRNLPVYFGDRFDHDGDVFVGVERGSTYASGFLPRSEVERLYAHLGRVLGKGTESETEPAADGGNTADLNIQCVSYPGDVLCVDQRFSYDGRLSMNTSEGQDNAGIYLSRDTARQVRDHLTRALGEPVCVGESGPEPVKWPSNAYTRIYAGEPGIQIRDGVESWASRVLERRAAVDPARAESLGRVLQMIADHDIEIDAGEAVAYARYLSHEDD